uniref:hypothetical protein n=1 Tax=Alloprevotella sp. TaxID=1872471 RepID=UPI00402915D6
FIFNLNFFFIRLKILNTSNVPFLPPPPHKEIYEQWGFFLLYNIQNVPLMACTNLSVEQQSD